MSMPSAESSDFPRSMGRTVRVTEVAPRCSSTKSSKRGSIANRPALRAPTAESNTADDPASGAKSFTAPGFGIATNAFSRTSRSPSSTPIAIAGTSSFIAPSASTCFARRSAPFTARCALSTSYFASSAALLRFFFSASASFAFASSSPFCASASAFVRAATMPSANLPAFTNSDASAP